MSEGGTGIGRLRPLRAGLLQELSLLRRFDGRGASPARVFLSFLTSFILCCSLFFTYVFLLAFFTFFFLVLLFSFFLLLSQSSNSSYSVFFFSFSLFFPPLHFLFIVFISSPVTSSSVLISSLVPIQAALSSLS